MKREELWKRTPYTRRRLLRAGAAAAIAVSIAAFGSSSLLGNNGIVNASNSGSRSHAAMTVGIADKQFTESYLVADMYQDLLSAHGIPVSRHSFGTSTLAQAAITKGTIDLYPEYTGTGLTDILKLPAISNAIKAYDKVKRLYQKKFKLTWLEQSPFNDTNGVGMKQATANKYHIKTMSDLAKAASNLTFVGLAECAGRPDCLAGMKKVYGINFKKFIPTSSTAVNYQYLLSGRADASEVFTTDSQIAKYHLFVPKDNKGIFPADHVAPVIRDDALRAYPKIRSILNRLAPLLTTKVMSGLNAQVDFGHKDHASVARSFLKAHGLLK
ncbi:MAG TPA: glycine betaine ABC transporter substrate-binding protein [Chloroflexota bacterium]|nr:glycine betaine ABC transporter substrate-binding protein [Chloroflexota bacterium]